MILAHHTDTRIVLSMAKSMRTTVHVSDLSYLNPARFSNTARAITALDDLVDAGFLANTAFDEWQITGPGIEALRLTATPR